MSDRHHKEPGRGSPKPEEWSEERIASLKEKLRQYTLEEIIRLPELLAAANRAKTESHKKATLGLMRGISHPNTKAAIALERLSDSVGTQVWAHGVGSNIKGGEYDSVFAVKALVNILVTGQLDGWSAPVKGGVAIFDDAPFILLSNKGEKLVNRNPEGKQYLSGLRTVLVNGEYEGILDLLKKAFPFVSFRTADQIHDSVFDTSDPPYRSYEEREKEEIQSRIDGN